MDIARVTLHVGLGTFRPVKVDDVSKHHMHTEFYQVTKEEADKINKKRLRRSIVQKRRDTVLSASERQAAER